MEYIKIDKDTPVELRNSLFVKLKILLADLEFLYPYFTVWLEKVFTEMHISYNRKIFLCTNISIFDIVGVAIIKDDPAEKKICTLQVCKDFQRRGIGSELLKLATRELNDPAPLITVSGLHMHLFGPFLKKRGFKVCDKVKSLYRIGSYEYFFNKTYKHEVALLSIQPVYAEAIEMGKKLIEFRKKPFANTVTKAYVYSSFPVKLIIGYFDVMSIVCQTPEQLWEHYSNIGCISKDKYNEYFKGRDKAYGILIDKFHSFIEYKDPKKCISGFRAPQSFSYVDNVELLNWLQA